MRFLILAVAVLLAGCAPQTLQSVPTQSYVVGQRIGAAPGGILMSSQSGSLRTVRRWVGIANSPDGWETATANDSSYVRKELIYSGISGSTIEIGYREFRGGLAAPAFYQAAKYDLSASKVISFQNFRFEVDSADNNGLKGRLLSDGTTTASTAPQGDAKAPAAAGRDTYSAEQLARRQSCAAKPSAILTGSGAGFENYSVQCASGDVWAIRCEMATAVYYVDG
jgi:hypothetical protein